MSAEKPPRARCARDSQRGRKSCCDFFADASLRGVYVRALRRSFHGIDLITAHEAGLLGAPDDVILNYAAAHGRIAITQDFATLPDFA
jgi:predicted nuclease of predicted toxin-antitoxin system